jgi:hypothetical protein
MEKSLRRGTLLFVVSLVILPVIVPAPKAFSKMNGEKGHSPDILIIYSSGTPLAYYSNGPLFKKIREMTPEGVDAVTTATPLKENCKTIAEKLAAALRERALVVRVAEAKDIAHRDEILRARLIIIGSPSRFGNVSWELKKLFDEQFSQIGALEEKGLAGRRIAAFSMAEVEPSAKGTLRAIEAVAVDCNGRFGPTMIFLIHHSKKTTHRRIDTFVQKLLSSLAPG